MALSSTGQGCQWPSTRNSSPPHMVWPHPNAVSADLVARFLKYREARRRPLPFKQSKAAADITRPFLVGVTHRMKRYVALLPSLSSGLSAHERAFLQISKCPHHRNLSKVMRIAAGHGVTGYRRAISTNILSEYAVLSVVGCWHPTIAGDHWGDVGLNSAQSNDR